MLSIENQQSAPINLLSPSSLSKSASLSYVRQVKPNSKKRIGEYFYRQTNLIGSGYSSHVYRGYKAPKKNQFYAIKVIKLKNLSQFEYSLLKDQIKILKQLDHPNIIKFHEAFFTKNHCYIIADYCEGGNLEEYASECKGALQSVDYDKIFEHILKGCHYLCKKKIMHRDIKPANIFLKGSTWKIGDFGFAKQLTRKQEQHIEMSTIGSPLFMPPQILFDHIYSLKADSFSFGITLFYIATLQYPWIGKNIEEIKSAYIISKFPLEKLAHLDQTKKNIIYSLCQLNYSERIYNDQILVFTQEQQKQSKTEESLLGRMEPLSILTLVEKVKLCKFVVYLWQNINREEAYRDVNQDIRDFVVKVLHICFSGNNNHILESHFSEFMAQCSSSIQNQQPNRLVESLEAMLNLINKNLVNHTILNFELVKTKFSQFFQFVSLLIQKEQIEEIKKLIQQMTLNPHFTVIMQKVHR